MLSVRFCVTVCSAAACDNSTDTSTPTTPTIPLTSQTFTGTIAVGGASSNTNFVVAQNGEVDVTIDALGPPSNIILGLAIGIPSTIDTSCTAPVSATDPARPGVDVAARRQPNGGHLLRAALTISAS